MAPNVYEVGLKLLLTEYRGLFNDGELAILMWLHKAAQHSEDYYWAEILRGSIDHDLNLGIEVIKVRCRNAGLTPVFEELYRQHQTERREAA